MVMATESKTQIWLVTGCSSGFGKHIVEQVLKRNQTVIATGRNVDRLKELGEKGAKVKQLDINAPIETLREFASSIIEEYGHVDVLVNNAGYMQRGTVEESSEELLEQQFKTNVFAPIAFSKAFLPSMRERRSGTIVMVGSIVSYVAYPMAGIYDSSKAALRILTSALAQEVHDLGIRVTHIEPGLFRTSIFSGVDLESKPDGAIDDYDNLRNEIMSFFNSINGKEPGDPSKLGSVIVDVVLGEGLAAGKAFPSNLTIGAGAVETMERVTKADAERVAEWKDVSLSTEFDD